jgi:transcriptional antiterminator NusG
MKKFKWYIINTQLGSEYNVKQDIIKNINKHCLTRYFKHIIIPTNILKKKTVKKKLPGCILIKFYLNSKTWLLIRQIPKVINFIGSENKPANLYKNDIKNIYNIIQEQKSDNKEKTYKIGNIIKIIRGPFINFSGIINKIDLEKKKVNVTLSILGRNMPINLDFNSIDKAR